MAYMKSGVRVVRGPDFCFGQQDGGNGYVGTIVYIPKQGSSDQKVTVVWDSGRELRYRAGEDGKYDLRMLDNGPIDIVHDGIVCDSCDQSGVIGFRWKCTVCVDYDLCTKCYMENKHDTDHSFIRIVTPKSNAFTVAPRERLLQRSIQGSFIGAEVMRGPHWKWKNDDGGEGKEGLVQEIVPWGSSGHRGALKVKWKDSRKTGTYRVGGEGSVDLVYTKESELGTYYLEHLPLVDVVNPGEVQLKCSDRIRVNLSIDAFKSLQDNLIYGSWADGMKQCTEEVGTIVSIMFDGRTVRAQYTDGRTWNMNRAAVTRVHSYTVNEAVVILEDLNSVNDLQEGHGGWNDKMTSTLGKIGRIACIDKDGDLRVKIADTVWVFNPTCCSPVETSEQAKQAPDLSKSELEIRELDDEEIMKKEMAQMAGAIADLFVAMLRGAPGLEQGEMSLVEAAGKGDMEKVMVIVLKDPSKVNEMVENKAALQLASYEGHTKVVEFLLEHKADIHLTDEEDDTALHYSAFGEELNTMKVLLDHGAKKDAQNKKGLTPLHVSVAKGSLPCIKHLIKTGASVIIKDKHGDTSMHDCITQRSKQPYVAQEVLASSTADFKATNQKGFNVLHWATIKNHQKAAEMILSKKAELVNAVMPEGFTSLHIAAANDHIEIASLLIKTAAVDCNIGDQSGRTALHISVSQSHKRIVELLIAAGCAVDTQDNKGNTALHIALAHQVLWDQDGLAKALGVKRVASDVGIEITCLLVEARANLALKNVKGQTPLDVCNDVTTTEFLKRLSKQAFSNSMQKTNSGVFTPSHWDQMTKEETVKHVVLNPQHSRLHQNEFEGVRKRFQKSLPQATISKIERIQNKYLWEHYYFTRMKFEQKYGPGCANEQVLFHGTDYDRVDTICLQNFDPRLAGDKVGTLFGKGAYFAAIAKYSDGYSSADPKTKKKYMFVVKVLAGKITLGDPSYRRPPPVDERAKSSALYDSCVDDDRDPNIYCIFDHNQLYPDYIIEYK